MARDLPPTVTRVGADFDRPRRTWPEFGLVNFDAHWGKVSDVTVTPQTLKVQDLSDRQLATRMAKGDEVAVGLFYDRHAVCIYGFALQMVWDPNVASTLCCSAFRDLWTRTAEAGPPTHPLGFALNRVALRVSELEPMPAGPRHHSLAPVRPTRSKPDGAF